MRIFLAFRAFFAALFRADSAKRIQDALAGNGSPANASPTKKLATDPTASKGSKPPGTVLTQNERAPSNIARSSQGRNDAITLLAVLQRDARLLDLIHESLDDYTDEQIGGAARNVLRDTRKALERLFDLKSLVEVAEGDRIEVPSQASPIRWRLLGSGVNSTNEAGSLRGTLVHAGWIATKADLPTWTGKKEDVLVVAPVEVEAGA
ncbi:MAG: DUF2760 domain-containing protein [Planctomycetes bacterium]|nr:DUF2760 domain-containing protein [Planctomycetota bacterium]